MPHTPTTHSQILIIGAGPGGAAAAWALAGAGLDVLLLDARSFPRDKTCGDGLTPMAVESLRQMGLLDRVLEAGATRVDTLSLTAPLGISSRVAFSDILSEADYALVLPRLTLDHILVEAATAAGARLFEGWRVTGIEWADSAIRTVAGKSVGGPFTIQPEHVVVAVGANVGFLRRHGFLTKRSIPMIRAARAYYADVHPLEQSYGFYFTARLAPGYGWVFPTGPESANIGVAVSPVYFPSKRSTATLLDEFVAWLQKRGIVDRARRDSPVKGYPIRTDFPSCPVAGANWVIVGEAAGLVNPVTGEGIDLALRSGLLAGETIAQDIRASRPDHTAYESALRRQYARRFLGLRLCRDLLMLPVIMDYFVWQMNQHRFIRRTVTLITQGHWRPIRILHPLFVALMLVPLSPHFVVDWLRRHAAR
jgi:geranylgeranyl reductase family protein